MPTNEYGHAVDEDWVPDNPTLRGETRTPDDLSVPIPEPGQTVNVRTDELPHRIRAEMGLADDRPDPGYLPELDDLV